MLRFSECGLEVDLCEVLRLFEGYFKGCIECCFEGCFEWGFEVVLCEVLRLFEGCLGVYQVLL